jgi:nitroreductase
MTDASMTRAVWNVSAADFPADGPIDARAEFCLRYAILAPSSHNTQPWRFAVEGPEIEVRIDRSRWLEVADHDRRELFLSVGCALENLLIAADHFGLDADLEYRDDDPADPHVATVTLGTAAGDGGALDDSSQSGHDYHTAERVTLDGVFDAITQRRTSHEPFEDRSIPPETLDRIEAAADVASVASHRIEEGDLKRKVARLQYEADERQMSDPEYRKELGRWIGRGALGDAWLKARIGQLAVTYLDLGDREGEKNSTRMSGAPVLEVIATPVDDRVARLEAGRTFQRMALVATAEGLAVHPISQILEVPALKAELARAMGVEDVEIQHLFRLGYAEAEEEHTPRWPVEAVLESA